MPDPLPAFDFNGRLPAGIHRCSVHEFVGRFCQSATRQPFADAIRDIMKFSASRNANRIFIGGSFVTNVPEPNDLDVVVAFKNSASIPLRPERVVMNGTEADIMFCSDDEKSTLDGFVYLLTHDHYERECGVVEIAVDPDARGYVLESAPDDATYQIIKQTYFNRVFTAASRPRGVLVTIHGIHTAAPWNSMVGPIASSQGWVFAPYVYGMHEADILFRPNARRNILTDFREWLYRLASDYSSEDQPVSVIAHSFGTYLIGSYLEGFEQTPVEFDTLILTGSVLNEGFDWNAHAGRVGHVRNEIAPNDQVIGLMRPIPLSILMRDPLFGRAGVSGFHNPPSFVSQPQNAAFDHNNVLKRDVVAGQWMPLLNSRSTLVRSRAFNI